MAFTIAPDEISLARQEQFRTLAKQAALRKAINLRIATRLEDLAFREALPATDLGVPAGTGYGTERYVTGAIAATTWTSVYPTAAVPTVSDRQILVFYKIYDLTAPSVLTAVRFRLGPTGATTLGVFFVEELIGAKLTPEVYLSEPIVYGPNERPFIECYTNAIVGAGGERVGFGCFVAEPVGEVQS